MLADIFFVPVKDKVLLYAPLHGINAVINQSGARVLSATLQKKPQHMPEVYEKLLKLLQEDVSTPEPRRGGLQVPRFLGLLPTRDCNMRCRYCDFPVSGADRGAVMTRALCQDAIDAYFELLKRMGQEKAAIHYFGGEPFCAPEVVFFSAEYARFRARKLGFSLHLEASSNGLVEEPLARWISNCFDCIVLSLDGKEVVQNYQRPAKQKLDSFTRVITTAKILSESPCSLILRSCITQESLPEMQRCVEWMVEDFAPDAICLEPMTESNRSDHGRLHPPDPWDFSKQFLKAQKFLDQQGIECILSTADLSQSTVSSCPVGHDALIVSPNGDVDACYLLKNTWLSKGKDMHLGMVRRKALDIQQENLDRVRSYQLENKSLCRNCFCRYHCAGGCHVNHPGDGMAGRYDDICIRTRLVSMGKILLRTGQTSLLDVWLGDEAALNETALWRNDRMESWL